MSIDTNDKLIVEIWSDLVCPWCWLGLTRLEWAIAQFDHGGSVELIHHSFRLAPGAAPEPVEAMLGKKYGLPLGAAEENLRRIEATAAADGLTYDLAGTFIGDTLDAHRLVKLAATQGRGEAMVARFYRGYFSEHASLFDNESLLRLAGEAGLDRDAAAKVLANDDFRTAVEADQHRLAELDGQGVPFFLIGGRFVVSGAQSSDLFGRALQKAWSARETAA
jgi:predicted DsbA family dithiol-disulfide isomerase